MSPDYRIHDTSEIITPALVVFREILDENIRKMIAIAGDPARLRPHCKTHKTREVVRLELESGITKHKTATVAEAEMLAEAGVGDILLAYNPVGPNIARCIEFRKRFPDVRFSVTADHELPLEQLSEAASDAGQQIDVLLDVDTGQHRTGLPVGPRALALYGRIVELPGVEPGGLHIYDGHQRQQSRADRTAAIEPEWRRVMSFRREVLQRGWPVPAIVAGATASFPVYALKDVPGLQFSPGTCVFQDTGYSECFPDLDFTPAAVLLTRVISRPTPDRVTLDLGYKAVASDPPAGRRVCFPELPQAKAVLQNEEHLVLETPEADRYQPGDELIAIPTHICPTSALHREILVVTHGRLTDRWTVVARDRRLSV